MKYIYKYLLVFGVLLSCTGKSYDPAEYRTLALNPDYNKPINTILTLKLVDSLNISTKNKPIYYPANDIYQDSLFFGIALPIVGGKNKNKIEVFNMNTQKHLKTIEVVDYKLKQPMSTISVHSLDTIIVTHFYPPGLKIINYSGKIIKDIKLSDLKLNIDNPMAPSIDNYYITSMNNKPQIINNKIYFLIEPIGSADMNGFRNAEKMAIYDLKTDKLIKAICPPKGTIALEGVFYPHQLMNPYFLIAKDKIYINYPLDHYVYIYDLEGKFLEKKLLSASEYEEIPKPIPYKKLNDSEYIRSWWLPIPFYGPLNYHKHAHLFTRIFHQSQPLKIGNKLNNGDKRTGYIIIYDENLNKIGETFFDNGRLGVYKTLPLSDGFLIAPNQEHWSNENEFVEKYIYRFKQN